jgi:hypothetical protein
MQRPPFFTCDEADSFARLTFVARLPSILERLLGDWSGEHEAGVAALRMLLDELKRDAPTRALRHYSWDGLPVGRQWSTLPFLYAEIYFYQAILECVGYFDAQSSFFGRDVFR